MKKNLFSQKRWKTLLFPFLLFLLIFSFFKTSQADLDHLSGYILLQTEDKGQAWYVNPSDSFRYFLGRPEDAFAIMKNFGLGIKTTEFDRYQLTGFPKRLLGKILLTVEKNGEAYYINPRDSRANYLGRPQDAFRLMTNMSLGISNKDLNRIKSANLVIHKNSDVKKEETINQENKEQLDKNEEKKEEFNKKEADKQLSDLPELISTSTASSTIDTPPPTVISRPSSGGSSSGGSSSGGSTIPVSNNYELKINVRGLGTEANYGVGAHSLLKGKSIILQAVPADFYVFVDWTDENGESLTWNHSYSFTLNRNRELTANFIKNPSILSLPATNISSNQVRLNGQVVQMGDVASGTISFVYHKIDEPWSVSHQESVSEPRAFDFVIPTSPGYVYEYYATMKWFQDGVYMSKDSPLSTFATPKIRDLQINPNKLYPDQTFIVSAEVENLLATSSRFFIKFKHGEDLINEVSIDLASTSIAFATTSDFFSEEGVYTITAGEKNANVEIYPFPFSSLVATTTVSNTAAILDAKLETLGLEESVQAKFQYRVKGLEDWQESAGQNLSEIGNFSEGISGLTADTIYEFRNIISWGGGSYNGEIAEFTTKKSKELSLAIIGEGEISPTIGSHIYQEGTEVDIAATAGLYYHFVNWTGDISQIESQVANSTKIVMIDNYSITANFAIDTYEVNYLAAENGSISGPATQNVNHGSSTIAIAAVPDDGYYFSEWSDGLNDNPRSDNNILAPFSVSAIFLPTFTCGLNSVSDIDGNTYNTLAIGDQCWFAENLKTTKYQDGTPITFMTDAVTWTTNGYTEPYAAWYKNNIVNKNIYGGLYNFKAATHPSGICPTGWHVPSDDEFKEMEAALGMSEIQIASTGYGRGDFVGLLIKSARTSSCQVGVTSCIATTTPPSWTYKDCSSSVGVSCAGNNESGFSVLPGGSRSAGAGSDNFENRAAYFWTSTEVVVNEQAWFRSLHDDRPGIRREKYDSGKNDVRAGHSIRCVKD